MDENKNKIAGSQSASKVLALLKQVGFHHEKGVRLKELIELTGQDRSTAHRLLACLVDEGFVERAAPAKVYRLGIEAMQLGLVSAGMVPVVDRFRPVMKKIARQTGDTVFLIVRSGDYALCLHREEGAYPIKVFVVEPGTRRPLGTSSVGVGILAGLPDAEIVAIHARQAREYERRGMPLEKLRRIVRETRKNGFSGMTDFGPEGAGGVGCAFRLSSNSYAGISIAAISSRMPAQRKRELGTLLQQELQPFAWAPGLKK
ncbi:IclR family transcriptional regulator [Polaromonas sp. C04]|uniref:IclR family transcriptional regulator n=1 Tax=Polaromonas sp. C04 TaxID=1945857 RepID=UPI0009856F3B|nr:IclR family transcriptional regulator [Polaromonas sp. C04]OOG50535.1 IclR family transcriptional regulator [Polaromonas sp. C04]